MFKLDLQELHAAHERDDEYGQFEALFAELSRQIREAGGPDGDLEQQIRTLLASTAVDFGTLADVHSRALKAETALRLARYAHESAKRGMRVESGQDMVDALARAFCDAAVELQQSGDVANAQQVAAGIRAVLSALAAMGADALPTLADVIDVVGGRMLTVDQSLLMGLYSTRIAPILAAKDHAFAVLSEQNRELGCRVKELETSLGHAEHILMSNGYARAEEHMRLWFDTVKVQRPDGNLVYWIQFAIGWARDAKKSIAAKDARIAELEAQLLGLGRALESLRTPMSPGARDGIIDGAIASIGIPDPPPPPPPPTSAAIARGEPTCSLCLDSGWVAGTAQVENPTRCLYGCEERP